MPLNKKPEQMQKHVHFFVKEKKHIITKINIDKNLLKQ